MENVRLSALKQIPVEGKCRLVITSNVLQDNDTIIEIVLTEGLVVGVEAINEGDFGTVPLTFGMSRWELADLAIDEREDGLPCIFIYFIKL